MPTTKARVLTLNLRRSSYDEGPSWAVRKKPLLRFLNAIPGGPPAVLLLQECTHEQQQYLLTELGYQGFGNGIPTPGYQRNVHDEDRPSDNVAVLYNPEAWTRLDTRIYWVNPDGGPDRTYLRALHLQRVSTKATTWFATYHPPAGTRYAEVGIEHTRALLRCLRDGVGGRQQVDLSRLVLGADLNSNARYPKPGPRAAAHRFGLVDAEDALHGKDYLGRSTNTTNGFKPTRHDGRHIDAVLAGRGIRFRYARVLRTDLKGKPYPTDHNGVLAGIEL